MGTVAVRFTTRFEKTLAASEVYWQTQCLCHLGPRSRRSFPVYLSNS
jgi:hypothetical protein